MNEKQVQLRCFLDGKALMISNSDFKSLAESDAFFIGGLTSDGVDAISKMEKRQIELDSAKKQTPKEILLTKMRNLNSEMNLASGTVKACLREQLKLIDEILKLLH